MVEKSHEKLASVSLSMDAVGAEADCAIWRVLSGVTTFPCVSVAAGADATPARCF